MDRSNGATTGDKPTTDFIRANGNLPEPSLFSSGNAAQLSTFLKYHSTNNHTPGHIKATDPSTGDDEVYVANHDWGIKTWTSGTSFKEGDLFYNENTTGTDYVRSVNSKVKGTYAGAAAQLNDYVLHAGKWYQATTGIAKSTPPVDPTAVGKVAGTNALDTAFVGGDYIKDDGTAFHPKRTAGNGATTSGQNPQGEIVYTASQKMKGDFDANNIEWGNYYRNGGSWFKLEADPANAFTNYSAHNSGVFDPGAPAGYGNNDVVQFTNASGNTTYYKAQNAIPAAVAPSTLQNPDLDTANWQQVTFVDINTHAATIGAGWTQILQMLSTQMPGQRMSGNMYQMLRYKMTSRMM